MMLDTHGLVVVLAVLLVAVLALIGAGTVVGWLF
jgi:hypothetical protein